MFVAAISLILFSIAGTASALGYQPLAKLSQQTSNASTGCNLMGNKGSTVSGTNPAGKSTLELNMPSVETDDSNDVFKTPLIRA